MTPERIIAMARLEVVPSETIFERVCRWIPPDVGLTVTCLGGHGPDKSVELAVALAQAGFSVMPHLAARSMEGRTQLKRLLTVCEDVGIDSFLVVGGDHAARQGPYEWGSLLLEDVLEVMPDAKISVPGYPQGHASFSQEELTMALVRKAELGASTVVTQMCFDPGAYAPWASMLAEHGVRLPVSLGCPGMVARKRLIRMSRRIGVSEAMRFARGNFRAVATLMLSRRFRPDDLIARVLAEGGSISWEGMHLYSFNEIEQTIAWRDARLGNAGRRRVGT